jgi:hypothetical protein
MRSPMKMREKTAPSTVAVLATPSWSSVRDRSSRMMGISEAGANVARNVMKKFTQESCACRGGRALGVRGQAQ